MSLLRRPHVVLAVLAAVILVAAAAPDASAWLPNARRYHVGRPITLDTDLLSRSGLSAWAIDEYLQARTPLPRLGGAFIDAERRYGVNARFLLAAAMHESGWGTSSISLGKHNLFGYNAYDRDPGRYATAFDSYAHGIDAVARFMKEAYLTPGGRWYGGEPTLRSMQRYWSSSGRWGVSVSRIANHLHLGSLRKRGIRVVQPEVRGLVHGGDRVTIQLGWRGGRLPAAVSFDATWTPISIDRAAVPGDAADAADAAGGAPEAADAPLPKAVTVRAREIRARTGAATLEVASPGTPGRYLLQVRLLDAGRRTLPSGDRPSVPAVGVHVWGDQAVAYDLDSTADGLGVILRVTNTGTEPIPALPSWASSAPRDPEAVAKRSRVTLTATSSDLARPAPVVLLASPLAEDLQPGATLVFNVRGIQASTGRHTNWLSVDLRVGDDPSWLARYSPMGTRRSGSRLGTLQAEMPAGIVPTVGEGGQPGASVPLAALGLTPAPSLAPTPDPILVPAAVPTLEPAAVPLPTPTATPVPSAVQPIPTFALPPAPAPTAQPTATPTPQPEPAAARKVRHVTRVRSEDSRSVRYRGSWGSASGSRYMGGGVAWSTTPGATATFTFSGRSVRWIGPVGPTRGRALVRIDGKAVATVSMWSSSFDASRVLFAKRFKTSGPHTLSITVQSSPGHPYVAIDGFVVRT
jgi:hypothetical protein